jgi:hypothetical protein
VRRAEQLALAAGLERGRGPLEVLDGALVAVTLASAFALGEAAKARKSSSSSPP